MVGLRWGGVVGRPASLRAHARLEGWPVWVAYSPFFGVTLLDRLFFFFHPLGMECFIYFSFCADKHK